MKLLKSINGLEFKVVSGFNVRYMEPVAQYMMWKMKNGWDDYNELYHCTRLMEGIKSTPGAWTDTHVIERDGIILGVVLISGGVDIFEYMKVHADSSNSLMLNYFHIVPEARGNGERWLKEIIIPHYRGRGYECMFLRSSHARSFSLYGRLGTQIGEYTTQSDNGLHTRRGKIFRIDINPLEP